MDIARRSQWTQAFELVQPCQRGSTTQRWRPSQSRGNAAPGDLRPDPATAAPAGSGRTHGRGSRGVADEVVLAAWASAPNGLGPSSPR
jgi:hypothetical protein